MKDLKKIMYVYEDRVETIEGEYLHNQQIVSMMCHSHGIVFKPVKWEKLSQNGK